MSGHVFICYAREDREFALQLARMLKDSAIPVWVDEWDLRPGTNWVKSVDHALEECSHCLVVLSPHSVDSEEVLNEWGAVRDDGKPVVPVLYRECHVPYRLRQTQWISFVGLPLDDADACARLLSALGGSAPPKATPPEAAQEHAVVQYRDCRGCGAKTPSRTFLTTGGFCMKCSV
jgi:hypothetical protein